MNGPLEAVCVDGVCAVPATTSAPSERAAQDGADEAGTRDPGSARHDGVTREA